MIFRLISLLILFLGCAASLSATRSGLSDTDKGYFVRGIVRDSLTDEPIPNVFVSIKNQARGTMTNADGIFELDVPTRASTLSFKSQGYEPTEKNITQNRINLYVVRLFPAEEVLEEVVVKPRRYSKKNNPAVDLMEHIRRTASSTDPLMAPYYSFSSYQRMTFGLNNIDINGRNKNLFTRNPFLIEHVDTSEISGKLILPLSIREQTSRVFNRSNPTGTREIIEGKRSEGIDEILDEESMSKFMNDIMGPVDIFSRDINILQNRFVSPLSPLAADFYKFYITDSVTASDSSKVYTLSFYPRSHESFGFIGQMEVERTDSTTLVSSVSLRVPREINLNFIENLVLSQHYQMAPNGKRLKTRDEMTVEVSLVPGTQGIYARRVILFSDHSFEQPDDAITIFKPRAPVFEQKDATLRDSIFWATVRPDSLPDTELKIGRMMNRLRQNKLFYWGEKVLGVLVNGYIPTNKDTYRSKFDIGPMNTTVSANALEGARFRVGGMTTASLSPRFFSRFYGAWGTKDHRWKYGLELEYSIHDKKRHSREFPIHSVRLNSSYDIYRPGQDYIFTNPDNVFLSLHRPGIDQLIYHRANSLTYTLETDINFSIKAAVANERFTPSDLMPFVTPAETALNDVEKTYLNIELRYAPGEKFYQTVSNRIPINLDAPTLTVAQRYGSGLNATFVSFMKRFWFSAFGYLDAIVKGSHVWSRATPLFYLATANTNMSYTIQPESFALTAPMEFVADTHCSFFLSYWFNGNILNRLPLIKKLKLREVISLSGFYGHLSDRNNPATNPGMIAWPGWETTSTRLRTPYLEASVGLDNIFRCLRLDYVWRLNHTENLPSGASRHGLRLAFHLTF